MIKKTRTKRRDNEAKHPNIVTKIALYYGAAEAKSRYRSKNAEKTKSRKKPSEAIDIYEQ